MNVKPGRNLLALAEVPVAAGALMLRILVGSAFRFLRDWVMGLNALAG